MQNKRYKVNVVYKRNYFASIKQGISFSEEYTNLKDAIEAFDLYAEMAKNDLSINFVVILDIVKAKQIKIYEN